MDTDKLTENLRTLAAIVPDERPFISCYINLKQARSPVLNELEKQAEVPGWTLRCQTARPPKPAGNLI